MVLAAVAIVLAAATGGCARESAAPATSESPDALRGALEAYEEVRAALAADRLESVPDALPKLEASLESAKSALDPATARDAEARLQNALAATREMGVATDLAGARRSFGDLSEALIAVVSSDPRLRDGLYLRECPMVDTFNRWIQREDGIDNPYLGTTMPTCGSGLQWESAAGSGNADSGVAYYTCSMHTHVRSEVPGKCPICSMDLVAVTNREIETGEILIDNVRRQEIGIRTSRVERRSMAVEVRAAGQVEVDETRVAEVSVKFGGWVRDLRVNTEGQLVRRGETLFSLYSPDLVAAQGEYLATVQSQERARTTAAPGRADYLVDAARERLRRFDLGAEDIDRLAAGGQVVENVPIAAPVSGHVTEKHVVEGARVEAGQTLYRIAGLDRVWVEAAIPESELALARVGQIATVKLPDGGATRRGKVVFIHPILDEESRSGRARIELPNPGLEWKPGMYVDVVLETERGERLVVPDSAVLYTGERRLVFLDLGGGRLRPQEIEVGRRSGEWIEVRSGLEVGDAVVSSGTFLVAAESRVKASADLWR
jgi:Cu(I)/Ag(I) efflux system membrane fusion protein